MFKRKHKSRESLRYPQGFEVDSNRIFLPKVGWVGFRKSRHIKGKPKNATVFREIDHWYVSSQTEQKVADPTYPLLKKVGIDLGINKMVALSDGTQSDRADNSFQKSQEKLARLQRRLCKNGVIV